MIQTILILCVVVVIAILVLVFFGFAWASFIDWKYPPPPRQYRWQSVYTEEYKGEWTPRESTEVYMDTKDNSIFGKVVKQADGLYRATMWNGAWKEFVYKDDAKESVENYRPHIVK